MHIPKTGGTWVTEVLGVAGVPNKYLWRRSQPPGPSIGTYRAVSPAHADLAATSDYGDRYTFAFVRHPLDWWRSFWAFRMRMGWQRDHPIDALASSPDFDEFIRRVVEHLDGHLAKRFSTYIGPPEAPISFIGRFESLVDDLVRALTAAGERFDEAELRAHPPSNVNDYDRFPAAFDPELAHRLAQSEHLLIERFYADDPVPEWLVRHPATIAFRDGSV